MFPSPVTGTMYHPDTAGRIHKRLLKDAGIEHVRFHNLRHTAATMMLEMGINPRIVQEELGHADIETTLGTYSHVIQDLHKDVAEKKDKLKL